MCAAVQRSVLIRRFTPAQLYAVVADVQQYQHFVPWVMKSNVIKHVNHNLLFAELEVGFRLFKESYVSRVELSENRFVKASASNTPLFRTLRNEWYFRPGPCAASCHVDFVVEYQFHNWLYARAASLFQQEVVSHMIPAFERRACEVFMNANAPSVTAIGSSHDALPGQHHHSQQGEDDDSNCSLSQRSCIVGDKFKRPAPLPRHHTNWSIW